jgi:hypothetical protein
VSPSSGVAGRPASSKTENSGADAIRELVGDTTDELAQEFLDLVDRAEKN